MIAFVSEEADKVIKEADKDNELKYERKSNRNRTISKFREVFLYMITEPDKAKRKKMMGELIEYIKRFPVSIVPGRSPERKARKKRFYQARHSVLV